MKQRLLILTLIFLYAQDCLAQKGKWSEMEEITACDKTCGQGTKTVNMTCIANTNGEVTDEECEPIDAVKQEVIGCNSQDCELSGWSDWEPAECKECDVINQTRIPKCGDDKHDCYEKYEKQTTICHKYNKEKCTKNYCETEGLEPCPEGTTCVDASTDFAPGRECKCDKDGYILDTEEGTCVDPKAVVNGQWTEFVVSECSEVCGDGTLTKVRHCANPAPKNNGEKCFNEKGEEALEETITASCNKGECGKIDIDGKWSDWEKLGECSKTCNGGIQKMIRKCNNPKPQINGKKCLLQDGITEAVIDTKSIVCNTQTCPFTEWKKLDTCEDCEYKNITEEPHCGDAVCPDVENKITLCNKWDIVDCADQGPCKKTPSPCPADAECKEESTSEKPKYECICPEGKRLSRDGTKCLNPEDVDGGWTKWATKKDECTESCKDGERVEARTCTNPKPHGAGAKCLKEDDTYADGEAIELKKTQCSDTPCFEDRWTPWTPCPACSFNITQYQYPFCEDQICLKDLAGRPVDRKKTCSSWRKGECPGPCDGDFDCPEKSICKDTSSETEPKYECECVLGRKMSSDKKKCIIPPPMPPTARPIPVMPEQEKTVATVISKTASTVLIVMVTITLILFLILRIFTPDRVIQMNMEISLLLAHICLMLPPETTENEVLCRTTSIFIHFFFTACFIFIMLEALHMYSLVAFVVKKDGMFSRFQNTLIGWCLALIIILFSVCFEYNNYGGEYHCWLRMDTSLFYAQLIPVVIVVVITVTLIEAAGSADYKPLVGVDNKQRTSAKISQRTNLILLPFMIAHWILGMLSEYEQNLPLYGTFSVVNAIFGCLVFFFHCSNNQQVREKLASCFKSVRGKKTTASTA